MNSILAEKRYVFIELPLLLAALVAFYMLGAAALMAQAAKPPQISLHRAASLVVPAVTVVGS